MPPHKHVTHPPLSLTPLLNQLRRPLLLLSLLFFLFFSRPRVIVYMCCARFPFFFIVVSIHSSSQPLLEGLCMIFTPPPSPSLSSLSLFTTYDQVFFLEGSSSPVCGLLLLATKTYIHDNNTSHLRTWPVFSYHTRVTRVTSEFGKNIDRHLA
jgi:hypothetical protein